jgi:hypothetical protein
VTADGIDGYAVDIGTHFLIGGGTMSVWSWVHEHVRGKGTEPPSTAATAEVGSGRPEDTGGEPEADAADQHSTTGTTPNETFVGRAAGDDPGYLETGAEERAEQRRGGDIPDTPPHSAW